jgi:ribonuclease-3
MKKILEEAASAIGYEYKNIGLLRHALTHRSYANEHGVADNERMEFLGDSVLSIVISDHIFRRMENRTEGDLSKFRAAIVCEQSLAEAAAKFGLNKYIFLGKGEERTGGRERPSIVSDAFEAVIASIYLDGGIEKAREWVLKHLMPQIDEILAGKKCSDYKTMLQEAVQKGHTGKVTYEMISESGEDHNKRFNVAVLIDGSKVAYGSGKSKKEAEQEAAQHAYTEIKK